MSKSTVPKSSNAALPSEGAEDLRIGKQIRDLRKSKKVTLASMAEQTGKSVGYLSQVERGVSSLPIPVLQKISEVLGVQISWFFQADTESPIGERDFVVRKEFRRSLNFAGTGIREELLSPRLSGQIQMVLTTFEPGTTTGVESRQRKGEEAGFVQSGQLHLQIGDREFDLRAGDSFSIVGDEPHFVSNPSSEETVVLWVIAADTY